MNNILTIVAKISLALIAILFLFDVIQIPEHKRWISIALNYGGLSLFILLIMGFCLKSTLLIAGLSIAGFIELYAIDANPRHLYWLKIAGILLILPFILQRYISYLTMRTDKKMHSYQKKRMCNNPSSILVKKPLTQSMPIKDALMSSSALYKIVPESHINLANTYDAIIPMDIDTKSRFIHTAGAGQVTAVLHKFFRGQNNIVLVELDEEVLQKEGIIVRHEQNKTNGEFFPHLYVKNLHIPARAICRIIPVSEVNDEWLITDIFEKAAQ